jgi:hypothetical protein
MAADADKTVFVMHGARAAMAGGLLHIDEQVKALEQSISENPALAFDLARTVIESACKTILAERGVEYGKDDELPKVFKAATQALPFLPLALAGDSGARRSLLKTLSGLSTALHGVCELRNLFGFSSHGTDAPHLAMEGTQALLAAQAADAIVGFLYTVHRQDLSRPRTAPLQYDDNPAFNEWLDDQCEPVRILSLPAYLPSEVLFNVDQEAYHDLLTEYEGQNETEDQPSDANRVEVLGQ